MKSFIVLLELAGTILTISGEYSSDVDVTVTRYEDIVLTAGVETVLLAQTVRKRGGRGKIGLNSLTIFILWPGVWEGQTEGSFYLEIQKLFT